MLYQSFEAWAESPVTTTIDTVPIAEIIFPKITVCPPKNSYTDLNYDLMMMENMTLNDEIRNELTHYAMELLQDQVYHNITTQLAQIQEERRYINWFYGYSKIQLPFRQKTETGIIQNITKMETHAASGSVMIQYFNEKFDANKVDRDIHFLGSVFPPTIIIDDKNVTLHLEIKKVLLNELSSGYDLLFLGSDLIHDDTESITKNYTPPISIGYPYSIDLSFARQLEIEELLKIARSVMPGFKLSWYYTHLNSEEKIESEDYYMKREKLSKIFSRNWILFFNSICILIIYIFFSIPKKTMSVHYIISIIKT